MDKKGWHHVTVSNGNEIFMIYCPACGHHGIKFINHRNNDLKTHFTLSHEAFVALFQLMAVKGFDAETFITEASDERIGH